MEKTVKKTPKAYKRGPKTQQYIADRKLISKGHSWHDAMTNESFLFFPEKASWRERFIATIYEWAEKPDSLELMDFCMEYRIPRETIYEWLSKHEDIKAAYTNAKLILGSRRRKGALKREYDKDIAMRDMHVYDSEWLAVNKYHAQLKNQENDQGGMRLVMMEKFPSIKNDNDREDK